MTGRCHVDELMLEALLLFPETWTLDCMTTWSGSKTRAVEGEELNNDQEVRGKSH